MRVISTPEQTRVQRRWTVLVGTGDCVDHDRGLTVFCFACEKRRGYTQVVAALHIVSNVVHHPGMKCCLQWTVTINPTRMQAAP